MNIQSPTAVTAQSLVRCGCGAVLTVVGPTSPVTCPACGAVIHIAAPGRPAATRRPIAVIAIIACLVAVGLVAYMALAPSGPPTSQVRHDLETELGNHLQYACGFLGSMALRVHGVSDIDVHSDGTGTALVHASNRGLAGPSKTCDMRIHFRYVEQGDSWQLVEAKQSR